MSDVRSIAIVSPRYASGATVGGAETLLREIGRRLARRGLRVTFLATCAQNHFTWANELPEGRETDGELDVLRFPVDSDRDPHLFLSLQSRLDRHASLTRAEEETWMRHSVHSRALYDHLRGEGERYDRIIAGPYLFGVTYAAAQIHPGKTLLVPCLHDEPFAHTSVIRDMFHAVRGCVFNSDPERALAARLFSFPAERGAVGGMGLDPFDADPDAFAQRHGLTDPYVLYSGRREPLKGTSLLLEYIACFRERTGHPLTLALTGSGEVESHPFVRDFGFLPEAEKREAMAGARVFIHPSRLESFGIVLLEAFGAGTPGLVHAGSEVLRDQCERSGGGWWFRHYPDFETMLARLLDRTDERKAMGARGRDFVRRVYSWPEVEARWMRAMERL
ncbi:MAG: glycosyltransferase [Kiritimatiellae bacterium]|nr:glycosyltransferase [Kiritimatiellia bacterium]